MKLHCFANGVVRLLRLGSGTGIFRESVTLDFQLLDNDPSHAPRRLRHRFHCLNAIAVDKFHTFPFFYIDFYIVFLVHCRESNPNPFPNDANLPMVSRPLSGIVLD